MTSQWPSPDGTRTPSRHEEAPRDLSRKVADWIAIVALLAGLAVIGGALAALYVIVVVDAFVV